MTVGVRNDTPLHIFASDIGFLHERLKEAERERFTSFWQDVILRQTEQGHVATYAFPDRFFLVRSFAAYFALHMRLVTEPDVFAELFENDACPVLTKETYAPPVKYGDEADAENALIADGCVVEGSVKNAVLFRGAYVGKGCAVENAVLLPHCRLTGRVHFAGGVIGSGACLYDRVELHGHPAMPLFVAERSILH